MKKQTLNPLKTILLFFLFAFLIYSSIIVYGFVIREYHIEQKYLSFDLDGDGIFGGVENTEEKEYWELLYINGAWLMFLPYLAIPHSFIGSLLLLVPIEMIKYFRMKRTEISQDQI